MTTPLISTIFPTFPTLPPFFPAPSRVSVLMRLLQPWFRHATPWSEAPAERSKCTPAILCHTLESAGGSGVLLERRHPGGVVEASDVRADERWNHGTNVSCPPLAAGLTSLARRSR